MVISVIYPIFNKRTCNDRKITFNTQKYYIKGRLHPRRPATKEGPRGEAPLAAILHTLKFSEFLFIHFILLYLAYFCPPPPTPLKFSELLFILLI